MRQFLSQKMLGTFLWAVFFLASSAQAEQQIPSSVVLLEDPAKIQQQLTRTLFAAVIGAYIEEGDRQYRPFYLPQRQFLLAYLNAWGQSLDEKKHPNSLAVFQSLKSEYPLFRRYPEVWPSLYEKSSNGKMSSQAINLGSYRGVFLSNLLSTESWPLEKRLSQILSDLSSYFSTTQEDLRLAKVIAQTLVEFPFSEKIQKQAQGVLANASFHRFTPMLAQMKNEVVFLPAAATVVKSLGSGLAIQNYFRQYQTVWFVQSGTKIVRPLLSLVQGLKSVLNPFYQKDPTLYKALGISLAAHGYVMAHQDFWKSQDLADSTSTSSLKDPILSLAQLWNDVEMNYPALAEPVQFSKQMHNYFLTSDKEVLSEKILKHFSSSGPSVNEFAVLLTIEKMKGKDERSSQDFFFVDVASSQLEVWIQKTLEISRLSKDPSRPTKEEQDLILEQIQRLVIEGPLKKYQRDYPLLGTSLNGWGGNCVAQTMMFSILLKWIPWLQNRLGVALLPGHMEAVVIEKEGFHFLIENKVKKNPTGVVIYPGDYLLKQSYNTLNPEKQLDSNPIYVGKIPKSQDEELKKKFKFLQGILSLSENFIKKKYQDFQMMLFRESVLSDKLMSQGFLDRIGHDNWLASVLILMDKFEAIPEKAKMMFAEKSTATNDDLSSTGNFSDQERGGVNWDEMWSDLKKKFTSRKPIRYVYRPEKFSKEDYMEIAFVKESNQEYVLELRTEKVYELFRNPKYKIYTDDFLRQEPELYGNTIEQLKNILLGCSRYKIEEGYKSIGNDERAYVDLWLLYRRLEILTTAAFQAGDFEKMEKNNYSPWKEKRWEYLGKVLFRHKDDFLTIKLLSFFEGERKIIGAETRFIPQGAVFSSFDEVNKVYSVFNQDSRYDFGVLGFLNVGYFDFGKAPERWKRQGFFDEKQKLIRFPFENIFKDWDWVVLRENSERLKEVHRKFSDRGFLQPLPMIQGLVRAKIENEDIQSFKLVKDFEKTIQESRVSFNSSRLTHIIPDQLNQLTPKDIQVLPMTYLEARRQLKVPMPLKIELPQGKGTRLALQYPRISGAAEIGPSKQIPSQNSYHERQDGFSGGLSWKDSWGKSSKGQDLLDPSKAPKKESLLPSALDVLQDPKKIPQSTALSSSTKVHFSPDDLIYLMQFWNTGLTLWNTQMWDMIILYLESPDKNVASTTQNALEKALKEYQGVRSQNPNQVASLSITENQKKKLKAMNVLVDAK